MRIAFVLLCFLSVTGLAAQQDCYLGIGGPDNDIVFGGPASDSTAATAAARTA